MGKFLCTPGPVPVPDMVAAAAARPLMSHREPDFGSLLGRLQNRLRDLLHVDGPVLLLPGSGTGALEGMLGGMLRPGMKVLSVSCGAFGDRFRDIALRMGGDVVSVDVPWGSSVSPERVREALQENGDVRLVLLTHNETSTGVTNPIWRIVRAMPEPRPLVLVDAVSSLGCMPCSPETWGVDGLASSSQKGLLTPPGVALVWLSPKAWKALEETPSRSVFFDLRAHRTFLDKVEPQNPYTPPVTLFYALDAALAFLGEYGHARWFAARRRFARTFAEGVRALGCTLLVAEEARRSWGVTALRVPGMSKRLQKTLRDLGVEVAEGQGRLKEDLIRFAHYGDLGWPEIALYLGSLYAALRECGADPKTGALEAAYAAWNKEGA